MSTSIGWGIFPWCRRGLLGWDCFGFLSGGRKAAPWVLSSGSGQNGFGSIENGAGKVARGPNLEIL